MSHLIAWGLPKIHLDSIEMTGDWGHATFVSGFLKCTEALISIQHVKICSTQKNHPITTVSGSKSPISFVFWNRACVSVWEMKEKLKLKIRPTNTLFQNLCNWCSPVWMWLAGLWWCTPHICMWTFRNHFHSFAEESPKDSKDK